MVEPMQIDNTCCICTTKNTSHTLKHLRFYDVLYWSATVTNGLIILAKSPVPPNSLFKTNPLTAIIWSPESTIRCYCNVGHTSKIQRGNKYWWIEMSVDTNSGWHTNVLDTVIFLTQDCAGHTYFGASSELLPFRKSTNFRPFDLFFATIFNIQINL